MSSRQTRSLWAALVVNTLILAGCGGGGSGSSGTTPPPPPPAGNSIVPSWSLNGTVRAIVGGSQTVNVAFVTDDGKAVTNFNVTQNLSTLPAGWSSNTTSLSCASVTTDKGCVLLLKYAPTVVDSGQLSIAYSFTDSTSTARTGTATIAFGATSHNNVIATVDPAGQVTTAMGGKRTVTVQFTTDDGAAVTNLQMTAGLTSLPAGWSGPATFACAVVSTGSGCLLTLTYAPTAAGSGTIKLDYSFADNATTPSTGSTSIKFTATASDQNHVNYSITPIGQVTAIVGAPSQTVNVSFTTDDGKPASNLQITGNGLSALPNGWSGPGTFLCSSVSTGNGCQLSLTYAPTTAGSGTLSLNYQYTNGAGTAGTGLITISYTSTIDNNVIGRVAPSGQINALVNGGSLPVVITFTTDDANQASDLNVTNGLTALPAGWTGPASSTFQCNGGFATLNVCQLTLHFAPTTVESGTLVLNFAYTSNVGTAKTGSVRIDYKGTTNNNAVATVTPSGTVTAVLGSGSQIVDIVFTSDDGNIVSDVTVNSGLSALPTGWSVTPGFVPCAIASTGTACKLTLTFAPTTKSAGTVTLGYSFKDNSGASHERTVDVPFASIPTYFYANQQQTTVLRCAASFDDGSLSGCATVATGFDVPYGLTFNGDYVYVADRGHRDTTTGTIVPGDLFVCPVNRDGTFGTCVSAAKPRVFNSPTASAASGTHLYVTDSDGGRIYVCTITSNGSLTGCGPAVQPVAPPLNVPNGIAVVNGWAYVVDFAGGNLTICDASAADGSLASCTQRTIGPEPGGIAAYKGNLYVGTGGQNGTPNSDTLYRCSITGGGSVAPCVPTDTRLTANFSAAVGFGFVNGFAYVSGYGGASGTAGGIAYCPLDSGGMGVDFGGCKRSTDKATKNVNFFGLAAH